MKPENLISKSIKETRINDYVINLVEIDLKHINYGLDDNRNYREERRSNLQIADIISFFESLSDVDLDCDSDDAFDYFVVEKTFFTPAKLYRMVFCIEKKLPTTSGIITMFQIDEDDQ